mgnify:CR=1 FL=1
MADTRILLVDDEKEVTALLAKRLVRRGYQCDTAPAGLQALKAVERYDPSLIITDLKMPNMDGIAALKIIVEQWPTAQVILLSGHADMQLAVQAMSEGAFGYLMKPVDFDELLFKIEDAAMQSRLEGPESDMAR